MSAELIDAVATLRRAAETLRGKNEKTLVEVDEPLLVALLADLMERNADVLTTIRLLKEAGADFLTLDAAAETVALARLINGGAS